MCLCVALHCEDAQTPVTSQEVAADEESRLARLEQSVAALWEQVVAGGQRAEQRHTEVMKLYEEVSQGGGGGGRVGVAWLSGLMEQQLRQERRRVRWRPRTLAHEVSAESVALSLCLSVCRRSGCEGAGPRGWSSWSCSCRRWWRGQRFGRTVAPPLGSASTSPL